ncbi:MAG: 6-carboxytetrahydropterin synthase [Planctomycetes bacterium]|nr:6-carboxytetrahydropterin synthase [Planctomycetota bacterium]
MLFLTRRFSFSASHRLHSDAIGAAENACAYGICENIHGHNYRLEVTVAGEPDPKTGFFCNVMELHRVVDELVVKPSDHHHLNDVPLYAGAITTMEGLSQRIWAAIEPALYAQRMRLTEVLLAETDEHWVRLRKD